MGYSALRHLDKERELEELGRESQIAEQFQESLGQANGENPSQGRLSGIECVPSKIPMWRPNPSGMGFGPLGGTQATRAGALRNGLRALMGRGQRASKLTLSAV